MEVLILQRAGIPNPQACVMVPETIGQWRIDSLTEYHEKIVAEIRLRDPEWRDLTPLKNPPGTILSEVAEATCPGYNMIRAQERSISCETAQFPETNMQFMASITQMRTLNLFHGGRLTADVDSLLEAADFYGEEAKIAARMVLEKEFQNEQGS